MLWGPDEIAENLTGSRGVYGLTSGKQECGTGRDGWGCGKRGQEFNSGNNMPTDYPAQPCRSAAGGAASFLSKI